MLANAPHERRGHPYLSLVVYGSRERSMRLLDGLPVHIFPVSDLKDRNLIELDVDQVDDSVVPLANTIAVVVPGELLGAVRPGAGGQPLDFGDQALAISFGSNRSELFARRGLN